MRKCGANEGGKERVYIDIPGRGEVSPGAPETGREGRQDFRRLG